MKNEVNFLELDLFKDTPGKDSGKLENDSAAGQTAGATSGASQSDAFGQGCLSDKELSAVLDKLNRTQGYFEQERQKRSRVKRVIEALLFSSHEPLPFNKIREIADTVHPFKPRVLFSIIQELKEEYMRQDRSFRLEEIAQGFILRTCSEYGPFIELLYRNKRAEKLSQPAMEVLAIIAYRQPVTRQQVEAIRGVDCSGSLQTLLERRLVETVGRLEAPGRPTLYGITKDFLQYFGLRDLKELPKLA